MPVQFVAELCEFHRFFPRAPIVELPEEALMNGGGNPHQPLKGSPSGAGGADDGPKATAYSFDEFDRDFRKRHNSPTSR